MLILSFLILLLWAEGAAETRDVSFTLLYESQTADTLYLTLMTYYPAQALPGYSISNFYYMPWWGVDVDNYYTFWPVTAGYYSFGFEFGTYDYFPIAWPITVPEGNHSFQAYIIPGTNGNAIAVGDPLIVNICEQNFTMMDWELVVMSANQQGLNLRVKIANNTDYTWTMNFPSQPVVCFSLNDRMIYGTPVAEPMEITVYPSLTYYIPIYYFTPLQSGIYKLQAYLIMPDEGGNFPVGEELTVLIGNVQNLDYGAGDLPSNQPIDFYWTNSLYECIYKSEELNGMHGTITSLALYNNFINNNFADIPVKVYLGSTTNEDLLDGWIPASELSLVFDGLLNFPAGQNQIVFNLDTHFTLNQGQNLVMMIQRDGNPGTYTAAETFLCQASDPLNGRLATTNTSDLDPLNPPASASLTGKTPKLSIYYLPGSDVYDEHQETPLAKLNSYPNPFAGDCILALELKEATPVCLELFNAKGQLVNTLFNGYKQSGSHSIAWNGLDSSGARVANGIYLCKVSTGKHSSTKKLILLKD